MAGSGSDIIARLRLNGQQFVQDTKATFSAFNQDAIASAGQTKSAFEQNFAQIQTIARNALQMPRTDAGSLNLGVDQYQKAAAAAQSQAVALREVAVATRQLADANGDTSASTRTYVAAAEAAAVEAERNAAAATSQADVMERLQGELNRTKTAVLQDAAANDVLAEKSGHASASKAILQHVVRSTTDSFVAGLPVSMIFGEQIGRLGEAASLAGGEMGAFGAFMSSGYGIALTSAIAISAPFIAKLFEMKDELAETKKAADAAAQSADSFGAAESALGKIIDLQTGKLKTHNQVLIQTVTLQQQVALQQANAKIKEAADAQRLKGLPDAAFGAPSGGSAIQGQGGGIGGIGSIDASVKSLRDAASQKKQIDDAMTKFIALVNDDGLAQKDPSGYAKQVGTASGGVIALVDKLAGKDTTVAGENVDKLKLKILGIASLATDKSAAIQSLGVIAGGPVPEDLKPYKKAPKAKKAPDEDGLLNRVTNDVASYAAQYSDTPTFIEKADAALRKLDQDAAALEKRKAFIDPDKFAELQAGIAKTKGIIQDNLYKPFDDFLKQQDRAVQIQQLQLQGRDAEAKALQDVYTQTDRVGQLDDGRLKILLQNAQLQERIANALEDQRREVGIYVQSVGDLQRTFDQFLQDLGTKPGSAFKNLISGAIGDFRSLQRNLLSNALFGGIDRDISEFVRKKSPIDIDAGYLKTQTHDAGDALGDFIAAVRRTTGDLSSLSTSGPAAALGLSSAPAGLDLVSPNDIISAFRASMPAEFGGSANDNGDDNGEITVTARKLTSEIASNTKAQIDATNVLDRWGHDLGVNLDKLGVKLPKALTDHLGEVLKGASIGSFAGGAFASITGGRNSGIGSALGGALGDAAGKKLGDVAGKAIGGTLGGVFKSLGGPLGGVVGGVLGGVIGGLFKKIPKGGSTIGADSFGNLAISGTFGNNSQAETQSKPDANGVIQGINQIAQTLGAQITGGSGITIGTYNGKYRVNTQGTKLGGSSSPVAGLKDFGDDEQAAISYAIQASIQKGVISGISQASINILKSGQDLQTALNKATMIESIPKDLKAITDPVGAAIDDLNTKWNQTVAALKEGGATAEQMAQAQQLYNLQLQDVKANTDAADKALKDFAQSLKAGSNSPLSLRDQEAAAKTALQPFLSDIASGKAINQSAYQDAAQSFLDIERQLYGSTDQYFAAFQAIQEATSKAIQTIDNATPISSPATASDPFASQTANATQATATSTQTSAELLAQQSNQLAAMNDTLSQLLKAVGFSSSAFASGSDNRNFA